MSALSQPSPSTSLRLWPGVVAVVLMLFSRFVVKLIVPGFEGFKNGMMGALAMVAVFLIWWLFASRARWLDRLGGLGVMAVALGVALGFAHESMGPHWFATYAVPLVTATFLVALLVTRSLGLKARRAAVAAVVIGITSLWLLVRTDGIDGDHDSQFAWRLSPTAEEQLLAPDSAGTLAASTATADLAAAEAPWPGFRGPSRDGVVRGLRIATDWSSQPPAELWRRPVGPGWSSVAVVGDLIITQEQRGEDEVVAAYDLASGEPRWRHGDPVRFFESNAGAGPRATPTVDGGRVFTVGATGLVNALNAADGSALWSRDLVADSEREIPDWGFSGSPLVLGDLVYIAAAGQLVAYDVDSGERRWIGPSSGGYSSPHRVEVDGGSAVVMLSGAGLHAFDPKGEVVLQHEWEGFPMTQPAQLANGDLIFSSQEVAGTRRVQLEARGASKDLAESWTSRGLKPYFNDFVVHGGHLYGFDGRILAAVDLETGERAWKGGRYGSGQLILIPESNVLLVLSESGELALVEASPAGFSELSKIQALDGKTWNHPTVAGDVLIVRNAEEMVAYRLPAAGTV